MKYFESTVHHVSYLYLETPLIGVRKAEISAVLFGVNIKRVKDINKSIKNSILLKIIEFIFNISVKIQ